MATDSFDVLVVNGGSVVVFFPLTKAAERWLDSNLQDGPMLGRNGHGVEWRYAQPIVEGLQAEGFKLQVVRGA